VRILALGMSALIASAFTATPSRADEIFGGLYVHDVDTPLSLGGVEDGADVQLGWRGDRIGRTPLQPYAFASVNSAGNTHYAAVGISAKFGDAVFIRPGLGLLIHTGSAQNFQDPSDNETEFGSRILFEPEIGIGARIDSRTTIEASWVHLSHAQLFGKQNPGMDNFGVRLSVMLP
jgi:lipid A 3-O-deacylase